MYPDQLASLKPADQDLHCFQKQDISGFSRIRDKIGLTKYIGIVHTCEIH